MDLASFSARFHVFAEVEAKASSPLYAGLALRIAGDPEILRVASTAPRSQPLPNLLFASVQFLLSEDGFGIAAGDDEGEAFGRLRSTVLGRTSEVAELMATRLVQTNEVRRSIFIYSSVVRACQE